MSLPGQRFMKRNAHLMLAFSLIFVFVFMTKRTSKTGTEAVSIDYSVFPPDMDFMDKDFPQILHQLYFNNSHVPQRDHQQAVRLMMRYDTFEYHFWQEKDIEDLLSEEFSWFYDTYLNYPYGVQRLQAASYFILRKYGGAVIDTRMKTTSKMLTIVKEHDAMGKDCILMHNDDAGLSTEFMMCKEHSPFMTFVTTHLAESGIGHCLPHYAILFSTGSTFLTECFNNYPHKKDIYILPTFYARKYFDTISDITWNSWLGFHQAWSEPYRCSTVCWVLLILVSFAPIVGILGVINIALRMRKAAMKKTVIIKSH